MDCKKCVKEDVCKQKELFKNIREGINDMFFHGYSMNSIATIHGIKVEVVCSKAVKKQTEFSPGWTNADTKKL
jgi:hypothetical protein